MVVLATLISTYQAHYVASLKARVYTYSGCLHVSDFAGNHNLNRLHNNVTDFLFLEKPAILREYYLCKYRLSQQFTDLKANAAQNIPDGMTLSEYKDLLVEHQDEILQFMAKLITLLN